MKRLAPLAAFPVCLLLLCTSASGQYPYHMPNSMASYSAGLMNNVIMSAPLYQQMDIMNRKARSQGVQAAPSPAASASLTFAPGNGEQAVSSYVARIARQDASTGAQLRTALAGKNIPAIFGGLVAPFGLTNHDVADAITAHLIMRAMVVTGAPPPSPQGVHKVRSSVVQALARDPKMASPAYRGQIGGEAQLDFTLVNASWRAMNAGTWPADAIARYRKNAAEGLAREGIDLNATQLTAEGFVPK